MQIPKWLKYLYDRGINDQTISYFDLKPAKTVYGEKSPKTNRTDFWFEPCDPQEAEGVMYPTYYPDSREVRHRIKYFNPNNGPKVLSLQKHRLPGGEMPPFYVPNHYALDELKKAIQYNNGILWAVEGEPDVWATMVVNLKNMTSFFGVNHVPKNLANYLKWLGVRQFNYIMDGDDAGLEAGKYINELLYFSDIEYHTLQTPHTVFDQVVKDTTNVLNVMQYNPDNFYKYLDNIFAYRIEFGNPRPPSSVTKMAKGSGFAFEDLKRDTFNAIEMQEGITLNFDDENWSQNFKCILHHDHERDNPAFNINDSNGVGYCFKRKESFPLTAIARAYGLNVGDYIHPEEPEESYFREGRVNEIQPVDLSENMDYKALGANRPVQTDYSQVDSDFIVTVRSQSIIKAIEKAKGEYIDKDSFSVPFPIDDPRLVACGGYAIALIAGKLVLFIAASGFGKTTIYKTFEASFGEAGIHMVSLSPEFDGGEHADRAIQMQSGVNSIKSALNQQYWKEVLESGNEFRFGTAFDEAEKQRYIAGAEEILSWKGESYRVNRFPTDIFDLLAMFDYACDLALINGHQIKVSFIDYAQLIPPPAGMAGWDLSMSMYLYKSWCNQVGPYISPIDGKERYRTKKIGIVTSQATKAATRALKTKDIDFLREEDAMNMRPDYFNLILTSNWGDAYSLGHNKQVWREYLIYILKNTTGQAYDPETGVGRASARFDLESIRLRWQSKRMRLDSSEYEQKKTPPMKNIYGSKYDNDHDTFDTEVGTKQFKGYEIPKTPTSIIKRGSGNTKQVGVRPDHVDFNDDEYEEMG